MTACQEVGSASGSGAATATLTITATPVQAPVSSAAVHITATPAQATTTAYTWDVENRLTATSDGASFVYDGDGNRIKKTEGGETILYINKYYEKNLTTSVVTTNYYLGDRLIATRAGSTLTYVHQDAFSGTSVTTNSSGTSTGSIKYFSFGQTRSGTVSTPQKYTGQRLDNTGLYYYNARYYDPTIGRFISADTIVPNPANPQSLNRYSYCLNNPLKYVDPSGNEVDIYGIDPSSLTSEDYLWINVYCGSEVTDLLEAWGLLVYADPKMTGSLEADEEMISITRGTSPNGWAANYDPKNKTITLDPSKNISSHVSILEFAHEVRHAWQDIVMAPSKSTDLTFDEAKWLDTVYCEWDAYKYQADIDDKFGWGTHRAPWNQQKYFQSLDLNNSRQDYQKALHRFQLHPWENVLWWKIYTPELYLTINNLYNN